MQNTPKILIVAALALFHVPAAFATLVQFLDTAQMTQLSKEIYTGKITRTYSSWDPDNKMIYTYVKLNIDQAIKSDKNAAEESKKEVLIRIPGGETNGVQMRVYGVAHFKKGEETLVFLRHHQGAPTVVGMAQGKYVISTDPDSGKKMVSRQLPKSLEFVQSKAKQQIQGLKAGHTASHNHNLDHSHDHAITADSAPIELSEMVNIIQEHMQKEVK
ncbi:MAG TPA: hypothetical protein PKC21_06435 [Oligoflexia bacterium]|nr:hypothetical protein [Oligoflexia bacterium]HMR24972.1 hypothetical protein [Oligoflexia bacterium]